MIKFVQKHIGDDQSSFSVQIESNDPQPTVLAAAKQRKILQSNKR